jgi:transcriptional regulator with XRE-family HTH domain
MPIARHLKHPIALWIIDSRKASQPAMKPADVGRAIGVTEQTVRAWETARAGQTTRLPSADNLDAMARLFGSPAPGREVATDQSDLAAAIWAQTRALNDLVEELRQSRSDARRAGAEAAERAIVAAGLRPDPADSDRWIEGDPETREPAPPARTRP